MGRHLEVLENADQDDAESVKKALLKPKDPPPVIRAKDLLSTGSTVLNLALSGRQIGGFAKGLSYRLIGSSGSGKSWFSLTSFAEAARNKNFDGYRFIFDDAENGSLMDRSRYFGAKAAARIEPPSGTTEDPKFSTTVEEFYYHVDDAVKEGTPFIYVLDSMDALDSEDDQAKFAKDKAAHEAGKQAAGSYSLSKQKENSSKLRRVVNSLRDSGSILIMISQSRANIGFGSQYKPETSSGGTSLKFYCHVEIWTKVRNALKETVKGKPRTTGAIVQLKVEKNRTEGWEGKVYVPFYKKFGIDDVGGCIDYLVDEKHWKGNFSKQEYTATTVTAPEFGFKGSREDLVKEIEEEDKETELRMIVQRVWREIEAKSTVKRKARYE
jgi:RecA/RadA recombinase